MTICQVFIFSLILAITNFFPVSSHGHLQIAQILSSFDPNDLICFVQFSSFGILAALLIYFNEDIKALFKFKTAAAKKRNFKLLTNIAITCIVGVIVGLISAIIVEKNSLFNDIFATAIAMGVTGLVMVAADNFIKKPKLKNETKLTKKQATIIGTSQLFSPIPGISYPATTIVAGRLVGLDNRSSAKYSFITMIPTLFGVLVGFLIYCNGFSYILDNLSILLISNSITLFIGVLIIMLSIKIFSKQKSLEWFGYYRIVVCLIILIVALLV